MSATVTLPQTLYNRLEKLAADSKRTPEAIVKQAVRQQIELEEWQLAQIDAGLADLEAGRVHTLDEAYKMLGMKDAERKAA